MNSEMAKKANLANDFTGISETASFKNIEMLNMLTSLEPYLERAKGKFGYAVARNIRKIREASTEYLAMREELIFDLGEEELDDNGNPTGVFGLKTDSDDFREYQRKLSEFDGIEHTVEIYKVPYDLLPDDTTALEMLNLEWMLLDTDDRTVEKGKKVHQTMAVLNELQKIYGTEETEDGGTENSPA